MCAVCDERINIASENDLDWAERELTKVIDAPEGTKESRYRDALTNAIEAYEAIHYPLE